MLVLPNKGWSPSIVWIQWTKCCFGGKAKVVQLVMLVVHYDLQCFKTSSQSWMRNKARQRVGKRNHGSQKRISQNKLPSPPRKVKHYLDFLEIFSFTVNGSDLDSVTLKTYKVKDCERNLGSDDCIWDADKNFLLPVLRLAIAELTKGKKE